MMRREETAREYLDGPAAPADLAASLDDIDRLNAWFGGYALTLREIRHTAAPLVRGRSFVVVDVGGARRSGCAGGAVGPPGRSRGVHRRRRPQRDQPWPRRECLRGLRRDCAGAGRCQRLADPGGVC